MVDFIKTVMIPSAVIGIGFLAAYLYFNGLMFLELPPKKDKKFKDKKIRRIDWGGTKK